MRSLQLQQTLDRWLGILLERAAENLFLFELDRPNCVGDGLVALFEHLFGHLILGVHNGSGAKGSQDIKFSLFLRLWDFESKDSDINFVLVSLVPFGVYLRPEISFFLIKSRIFFLRALFHKQDTQIDTTLLKPEFGFYYIEVLCHHFYSWAIW